MRNYRTWVAVALALGCQAAAFDCKTARVAGFTYDLGPLARDIAVQSNATTPPTVTETAYTLNLCGPLAAAPDSTPAIDRCPAGAWVCRTVTNFKKDDKPRVIEVGAVAGTGSHDGPTLEAQASGSDAPKQLHWKMAGPTVDSVAWSTDITLVCDKGAKNEDRPKVVSFKAGVLELEWSAPAACALDKEGGGGGGGGSDGGDSRDGEGSGRGGILSTVTTIAFFLFALYLVVGAMYKYLVVRARGLDVIPNLAFWREFPYLCADFAQHVWSMVGGQRHGGYSVVAKSPYPPAPAHNYTAPSGMELVQVQFIVRHGARYPTAPEMNNFRHLFRKLRAQVPENWQVADLVALDNAWHLADSGRQETARIAQRLAQRYPSLVAGDARGTHELRFVSSASQRTVATAQEFRAAVDTGNTTRPVVVIPKAQDNILAMKLTCPRWAAAKEQEKARVRRENKVFDAIHGKRLLGRVSRRLGVQADALSVEDVHTMYALCGYEQALYGESGRWCTLLDPEAAVLMELRNDIEYTHVYGRYGQAINSHIACALMTSMAHDIDSALASPAAAASVFRFGHAETVMFVASLLGADRALGRIDPPITGSMGLEDAAQRGFKSSAVIPFSANWGIEIYRDRHAHAFFRLLLNERPVRLPGCADELCPLQTLRTAI
ncbi:hypothetical protein H4R19_000831, partial [Coemansia spiralis]